MTLFLLIFFSVYGLMHLYAFSKARAALSFGLKAGIPLALFMLVMILAPVIVRSAEKAGHELTARVMSYVGYMWLGVLFLFISAALCIDVYRIFLFAADFISKRSLAPFSPSSVQLAFFLPLSLSLVISAYGFFEAGNITTERLVVKTLKFPAEAGRLKIVQISDVHLGLIVRGDRLGRILKVVKQENPDILVSTGDLVDGQINGMEGVMEMLKEINPRYGKYAVTGNHEFYAGLGQALAFTRNAGFEVLRGKGLTVHGINIVGVDDPTARYYDKPKMIPERDLLSRFPHDKFTLLLKHRPAVDQSSIGMYDLQLSGHTHKGQIFPFSIVTHLTYLKDAGLLRLSDNSFLYVSRGTGTWGPPIRFLSLPEVTVIEIEHGDGETRIEKG